MGLLAVDVTTHGVVMSADSQPVEILAWENRVLPTTGSQTRDPIVIRVGGGFVGLIGFAGTETIEGIGTAEWLRRFSNSRPAADLASFCQGLAKRLTDVWRRDSLQSVLEILVTGEISGDLQSGTSEIAKGCGTSHVQATCRGDFVAPNGRRPCTPSTGPRGATPYGALSTGRRSPGSA